MRLVGVGVLNTTRKCELPGTAVHYTLHNGLLRRLLSVKYTGYHSVLVYLIQSFTLVHGPFCGRICTPTALQTAGAFFCAHGYCAVRTGLAAQPL